MAVPLPLLSCSNSTTKPAILQFLSQHRFNPKNRLTQGWSFALYWKMSRCSPTIRELAGTYLTVSDSPIRVPPVWVQGRKQATLNGSGHVFLRLLRGLLQVDSMDPVLRLSTCARFFAKCLLHVDYSVLAPSVVFSSIVGMPLDERFP